MGIADISHEQQPRGGVESESVRTNANGEPRHLLLPASCEDADRVLAAIRREEEIAFIRDEYARDALQSVHGGMETVGGGVHDVDIIVRRMGDVKTGGSVMYP